MISLKAKKNGYIFFGWFCFSDELWAKMDDEDAFYCPRHKYFNLLGKNQSVPFANICKLDKHICISSKTSKFDATGFDRNDLRLNYAGKPGKYLKCLANLKNTGLLDFFFL